MVEVAIVAFRAAMDEMSTEELDALAKSFDRAVPKQETAESVSDVEAAQQVSEDGQAAEVGETL